MIDEMELLAEIHEKCRNLMAASTMDLPDKLHVQGMKGGINEIMEMTRSAHDEVSDD